MTSERIKRAVESVTMPREAKARVAVNIAAQSEKRRRVRARVIIAAAVAAALLATGASAACAGYFSNRRVVPAGERFSEAEFLNSAVTSGDAPSSYSVEHAGDSWGTGTPAGERCGGAGTAWNKLRNWDNDKYIGGSTRAGEYEWTGLEVISAEGEPYIRDVYDSTSGAVKREFIAFDPRAFAPYTAELFEIDYGAIEEKYEHVSAPWLFYIISDKRGAVKGVTYNACYAAGDGANFTMEYYGDLWVKNLGVRQEYVLEDEYDSVYTYTSSTGAEFLIRAKDDVVAAECRFIVDEGRNYSSDIRFCIHASFMTPAEVEAIADCIDLHVG